MWRSSWVDGDCSAARACRLEGKRATRPFVTALLFCWCRARADAMAPVARMKSKKRSGRTVRAASRTPPKPGTATIRDVALAAGVSAMTVSNLINERVGTMRAETRQRTASEIQRLGYRPHAMARSLRLAKQLQIAMMIIDEQPHFLADPFTTHVVAGLSNELNSHGYGLLLQGLAPASFRDSRFVRGIRTDALCILLSGSDRVRRDIVQTLLGLGQPVLVFQDTLRFPRADLGTIRQADREGGRLVASEALKLGARRLVMLVPAVHWPAIAERVKGVRAAVAKATPAELRVLSCGDGELHDTQAALDRDITEHGLPDAIIGGNDQMGIAAMKLMAGRGLQVPSDVAI